MIPFSGKQLPVQHKDWPSCSETTLTGESWFHLSTPWGFEPRSLMMGSKRVVHWTNETWCEWSEIAGSTQGSPQQLTLQRVWNSDRRAVWSCWRLAYTLLAQSLVKYLLKGNKAAGLHIVATEPSEAPTEGRQSQWSDHVRVTNVARQR